MRSRNASLKNYTRLASIEGVPSNFGMLPPDESMRAPLLDELSKAVLDSVTWVSDSVSIMYTSSQCYNRVTYEPEISSIWKPGADTVYNHPLFKHNHSLDSVKTILDTDYIFYNTSDSTKFIGFDNGELNSNSDAVQPVKHKRQQKKNAFGWELLFMIITPIAFLFGMNRVKIL